MRPDLKQIFDELERLFANRNIVPNDGFMKLAELIDAHEEVTGTRISADVMRRRLRQGKKAGLVMVERRTRLNIADEPYRPICYKFVPENRDGSETGDTD